MALYNFNQTVNNGTNPLTLNAATDVIAIGTGDMGETVLYLSGGQVVPIQGTVAQAISTLGWS
jgi:hypothetical protein